MAGTATYAAGPLGRTQLSNPRTAKGNPLRCPECGLYSHPADTTCPAELAALRAAEQGSGFYRKGG